MGWYIPFHKYNALDKELDKWEYIIYSIPKWGWLCILCSLNTIYWLYWIISHSNLYKTPFSVIATLFLGAFVFLLGEIFVVPFVFILIWVVLNICAILHKIFLYVCK